MTTLPQVSPTYQAALEYAMRGFAVIPVKGKRPLLKDWPNKASKNSEEINSWAIQYPDCNVGIVTGRISNIFVLDVDKHEALYEIETKYGNLPETLTCQTGGGGLHYYFKYPDGGIGNSTGDLPAGLDIRGDGGQVVASPSRHESGNLYQWITKNEIADAPKWLLDLIRGKNTPSNNISNNEGFATFSVLRPPLNITEEQIRRDLGSVLPDDYDIWLKVGMCLWHQFNGYEEGFLLWDEWSMPSANYTGVEALRTRWAGFKPDPSQRPLTFATVRRMANIANMEDDPLTEFLNMYVYVTEGNSVHDLEGFAYDRPMLFNEFTNTTANIRMTINVPKPTVEQPNRTVQKRVPVSSQWMIHPERKLAQGFIYKPGEQRVVKEAEGRQWINKFYMPQFPNPCKVVVENGVEKMDSECIESLLGIFFRHMEFIIPEEVERNWFYGWMAFNLQRPDERCKVTPLLIATDHGTGRGWIVQLMNLLLGSWNCTKTKMSTLIGESSAGQFQDFMNDSLLCCIEEVKETDKRYGVTDAMRDYLTENTLEINAKYGAKQTKQVYTNFFFNSNHVDALTLTAEDRRINVFKTIDGPKDRDYYDRLYRWLKPKNQIGEEKNISAKEDSVSEDTFYDRAGINVSTGVACLYHWLKGRDLADFNWKRSMHNKSRQDLIENNQTEIECHFLEMLKSPPYPVMTLDEIEKHLTEQMELYSPIEGMFSNMSKQIVKLAQKHLTRQNDKSKVSRRYDPDTKSMISLEKAKCIRGWSLVRNKQFSTEEIRKMYEKR